MAREPKVVDVEPVRRRPLLAPLLLLLLVASIAVGVWLIRARSRAASAADRVAQATGVRSDVSARGDSLEVAVAWMLRVDSAQSVPDSVRVEVGLGAGEQASVSTQSAESRSDTLWVTAPAPGETASGYSCVAPIHHGRLARESCTPWQYVRPAADTAPTASDTARPPAQPRAAARAARVARIVVQPSGLQVDPDPDGGCARWQRTNPERSVWVEVNRRAVPECTGINGKPTVAQFCAFAILEDGRRMKTENSAANPYCDRLFREWAAERVS